MTILKYDGYLATVEIDADAGVLHGEVVNTRDVLTFSAKAAGDLKAAFAATIAEYRAWCAEEGFEPEKPYSGNISLRLTPATHRMAAARAADCGMSLNAWLSNVVECEIEHRPANVTHAELGERVANHVQAALVQLTSTRVLIGTDYSAATASGTWEKQSIQ